MPPSTTSNLLDLESLNRISPYTLEEFNKILESFKPYNVSSKVNISSSSIETLENTPLDYNIDLKVLVNSKNSTIVENNISSIITSLLVSLPLPLLFNLY